MLSGMYQAMSMEGVLSPEIRVIMGFLLMGFLIMEFLRTFKLVFYIKQSHRNPIQLGVYEKGGMPSLKLTNHL